MLGKLQVYVVCKSWEYLVSSNRLLCQGKRRREGLKTTYLLMAPGIPLYRSSRTGRYLHCGALAMELSVPCPDGLAPG